MTTTKERQEHWHTIKAMEHFGGGFVKQLHVLYLHADEDNQRRIRDAWPEYWAEYTALARTRRDEDGEDWWDK